MIPGTKFKHRDDLLNWYGHNKNSFKRQDLVAEALELLREEGDYYNNDQCCRLLRRIQYAWMPDWLFKLVYYGGYYER